LINKTNKTVSTVTGKPESKEHKVGTFQEATFNTLMYLALDATGKDIYVTCKDVIAKLELETKKVTDIEVPRALKKPLCVALDSDGFPIVTDEDKDAQVVYRIIPKQKGPAGMTKIEAVNDQQATLKIVPSVVTVDMSTDDIYFFDHEAKKIKKLAGNRACRMCGNDCSVM